MCPSSSLPPSSSCPGLAFRVCPLAPIAVIPSLFSRLAGEQARNLLFRFPLRAPALLRFETSNLRLALGSGTIPPGPVAAGPPARAPAAGSSSSPLPPRSLPPAARLSLPPAAASLPPVAPPSAVAPALANERSTGRLLFPPRLGTALRRSSSPGSASPAAAASSLDAVSPARLTPNSTLARKQFLPCFEKPCFPLSAEASVATASPTPLFFSAACGSSRADPARGRGVRLRGEGGTHSPLSPNWLCFRRLAQEN